MSQLIDDLRYAQRSLRKTPGFTIVAVITLALGIGATSTIFSFFDALVLKPLPYADADRLVRIRERRPDGRPAQISAPTYLDWSAAADLFDARAAMMNGTVTLSDRSQPISLRIARVTASYFDVLGVSAANGRTFRTGEDQAGKEHVVVLSHALWQTQFGGDPGIVGRTIVLDREPFEVIGVLPAWQAFDRGTAQLWRPLVLRPETMGRNYRLITSSYARLKPDVSLGQARTALGAIATRLAGEYPDSNKGWNVVVEPIAESIVGAELRTSIVALMAAVAGVLLIGCSNIANLALARAVSRERTMAIRASLGAGRSRLIQQLLVEHLVLALCGGLVGVGAASIGVKSIAAFVPAGTLPPEAAIGLDARVLLFALVISITTAVLFGIAPAWHVTQIDLATPMRESSRGFTASRARQRFRDGLVILELALAFVLLSGAALLMRSFFNVLAVDTGFESANVLTMRLPVPGFPPGSIYTDPSQFTEYLQQLQEAVDRVPGVRVSGVSAGLPLESDCCIQRADVRSSDRAIVDRAERSSAFFKVVSPSYFLAAGLRLERGRVLAEGDMPSSRRVVVISDRLARQLFPGQAAVGRHLSIPRIIAGRTAYGPEMDWEVVGVTADEKTSGLDDERSGVVYATYAQNPVYFAFLVVRSTIAPAALEQPVRHAIASVNKDQAVADVRTLEQIKTEASSSQRFRALLSSTFSVLACALAIVGVYGVISYSVSQRTQELGVRAALGASSGALLRLVLLKGLVVTTIGVTLGAAASALVTNLLASVLYKVSARDVETIMLVAFVLATASLVATYVPARRASKVAPSVALSWRTP